MLVPVTHYTVYRSRDIPTANIAYDGAVGPAQTLTTHADPIMVLNCSLDPTVLWNIDTHGRQEASGVSQIIEVFGGRTFPEMHVEWFIANDLRSGRQVDDFGWHDLLHWIPFCPTEVAQVGEQGCVGIFVPRS
jgi:hypothetical protein